MNATMKKTMKNAPRFIDDNHVLVTKMFAKNARIFGTPEYRMWKEIRKDCPFWTAVSSDLRQTETPLPVCCTLTVGSFAWGFV